MKLRAIAITTEIDRHNTKVTKEAIERIAKEINEGARPAVGVEHDPSIPPLGKVVEAVVEAREDGEFQLVIVQDIFERMAHIPLFDGTTAIYSESEMDGHPFVLPPEVETTQVSCDAVNFASSEELNAFLESVRADVGSETFANKLLLRKSVVPDPELVITLSKMVVGCLAAKNVFDKVGEKTAEKISEDLANFYDLVRSAVVKFAQRCIPKNRPVTYVFHIPGTPFVEMVAITSSASQVLEAVTQEKVRAVLSRVKDIAQGLQAQKIQFILNETGTWEFNFLLTQTGAVIGTEKSFSRRARKLDLVLSEALRKGKADEHTDEQCSEA